MLSSEFSPKTYSTARYFAPYSRSPTRQASCKFVERVQSITNSAIVRRVGGIESAGFRERVLASPLQRATLLSADARATAIVIYYSRDGKTDRQKHEFVSGLREIVKDATAGLDASAAITGGPVIGEAAKGRNADDMATIFPLMIFLIVVITYVVFRKVPLTLLPLGVVAIAVTWSFGLMGLLGWNMTMISAILIPLILAVGVAHSIHIISGYRRNLERGIAADEAVQRSLTRLLKPCFFASLTTAIGLLSLLVSDLAPVRQFAVIAAAGVLAAFVISIAFLPIMLQLLPVSEKSGAALISKFVMPLLDAIHDYRTAGIHAGSSRRQALQQRCFSGWQRESVSASTRCSGYRTVTPFGSTQNASTKSFGGGLSLEFLVSSPEAKLGTPAALRELEAFQAWLVANTTVVGATSIADLVKEAARIAREEGEAGYTLPRSSVVTNALLESMARDGELAHWLTADRRSARIFARIPLTSAQDIVDEIPLIREHMRDDFANSDLSVQITGQAVLAGIMQTNMIDSQLYSFSVALAVVSLMMILLLRSVPLGMLAVIPNLLPIVIGLGAMALADISFNPATVMIAAVALGIVVDDTVHMMTVFDREVRAGQRTPDAIRTTIMEVGRPVFVTSVLLAAGFALLVFGSFLPSRQIGGVIAVIVVAALATDLVILPAILRETFSTSRTDG